MVSDEVNIAFLGHFLEFEWYVFAHIAQDDSFWYYLVPISDKTAENFFLVQISHINVRLFVQKRIFLIVLNFIW